jgi:hypothetical protein
VQRRHVRVTPLCVLQQLPRHGHVARGAQRLKRPQVPRVDLGPLPQHAQRKLQIFIRSRCREGSVLGKHRARQQGQRNAAASTDAATAAPTAVCRR